MKNIFLISTKFIIISLAIILSSCSKDDNVGSIEGSGITNKSWNSPISIVKDGAMNNPLHFNASAAWTASTRDAWIKLTPNRGRDGYNTIYITIGQNLSNSDRIGTIVIGVADAQKPEEIKIYQAAH